MKTNYIFKQGDNVIIKSAESVMKVYRGMNAVVKGYSTVPSWFGPNLWVEITIHDKPFSVPVYEDQVAFPVSKRLRLSKKSRCNDQV